MSAIDKTAQGTAVLEASGSAGAEAARRRRRLLMERRDARLGKYQRCVRISKGALAGGASASPVPRALDRACIPGTSRTCVCMQIKGPGPAGGPQRDAPAVGWAAKTPHENRGDAVKSKSADRTLNRP